MKMSPKCCATIIVSSMAIVIPVIGISLSENSIFLSYVARKVFGGLIP